MISSLSSSPRSIIPFVGRGGGKTSLTAFTVVMFFLSSTLFFYTALASFVYVAFKASFDDWRTAACDNICAFETGGTTWLETFVNGIYFKGEVIAGTCCYCGWGFGTLTTYAYAGCAGILPVGTA